MISRRDQARILISGLMVVPTALLLAACQAATPAAPTAVPAPTNASVSPAPSHPDWFNITMTDAQTGQNFAVNDLAGKVVLIETMAEWCPNCRVQENEVKALHTRLGNPADLVSISLDVDLHEDAPSLQQYAKANGYDWRFAVAPLKVMRALGNLYSAEYLNPPIEPMLLIDRKGRVYGLPYGMKGAEALQKTIEPYLTAP
jgi:thiol-disulfide isomerase/thioredoxin